MKTKIILELGYNHNGSMTIAKQMIDQAEKLGIWAVKFQKWDVEGLPEWKKEEERDVENSYGITYYKHRKKLELNIDKLLKLKKYANEKGLVFVCSGKDFNSIKKLVENGIKWIKLPSQRYGNNRIFKYLVAHKQKHKLKIIVSTGMLTEHQILSSKWLKYADVIMHCISKYPAELEDCDIAFMRKHRFYNGYSSHEINGEVIVPAIICGAKYIERHYTYDKEAKGSDHQISSDLKEMKKIIKYINHYEKCLGNGKRNLTEEELKIKEIYRKF